MKIMRMSGLPLSNEDEAAFKAEWQIKFDELAHQHGNDMLSLQAALAELEPTLKQKHNLIGEVDMPKSLRAWMTIVKHYSAPIMLAPSSENPKELVLVVMDERLT